jgi:23S rRNA (guanosine2251-2'-O)-methyltransferase
VSERSVVEGLISVQAVLTANSRPVHEILLRHGLRRRGRALGRLERLARERGIPVKRVHAATVDEMAQGQTHGGVVAVVGPRRFRTLQELLPEATAPFLAMLDGIEDPYNFGAAVRALYASGVHGLVLRRRNWMSAAGTVARSSAGASELIPTALVEGPDEAAAFCREHGLTVACAMKRNAVSIYDADLTRPLLLVVGGEKRGITRSFVDRADLVLQIPYRRRFQRSLGTAAAVAVMAFEVMRQRGTDE